MAPRKKVGTLAGHATPTNKGRAKKVKQPQVTILAREGRPNVDKERVGADRHLRPVDRVHVFDTGVELRRLHHRTSHRHLHQLGNIPHQLCIHLYSLVF